MTKKLDFRKKILIRLKLRNCFLIAFIIFQLPQSLFDQARAVEFEELESLAYECFSFKEKAQCRVALAKSEELQAIAGSNENYPCQTSLLGFQSKLIMLMLNMPNGSSYLDNLDDVKRSCTVFF